MTRKRDKCLIPLPSGKWRVLLRYRAGGKIREMQATRNTKAEAVETLAEMRLRVKAIRGGCSFPMRSKVSTFGECIQYYLARRDPGKAACILTRLKNDLGGVSLAELGDRFEQWFNLMRDASRRVYVGKGQTRATGRTITPATLNRYLSYGSAAVNLCHRHGLVSDNPLRRFSKLPETPRDVSLTNEDRRRLLITVQREAPHIAALVEYALQVPCRKGELLNARREDLDMLHGTIRLRNGTTKTGRGRDLPIPPLMLDYFRDLPADTDYLFHHDGKPLGDFKRAWKRCLKLAGLSHLHFHDTRHISASDMLNRGTPIMSVCAVAGWTSPAMLTRYYNRHERGTLDAVIFGEVAKDTPHTTPHTQGVNEGISGFRKVGG